MFFFMIPFGEPENLGTRNFHFWQSFISIPDEGFSKMKVFQRNLPNALIRPVLTRIGSHQNRNRFPSSFPIPHENPTLRSTFQARSEFFKSDSRHFCFLIAPRSEFMSDFRSRSDQKIAVGFQASSPHLLDWRRKGNLA